MVMLVDSGATHNFVSRKLVSTLGLTSDFFSGINIQLGDGHKIFINQRCSNLKVLVGTCEFEIEALVFYMGHLDMVLGMEWLKTLGDVIHNWDLPSMRFMFQGTSVCIHGLSKSHVSQASLQTWLPLEDTSQTFLSANSLSAHSEQQTVLSLAQQKDLQILFERFATVFLDPTGLPPVRTHDHGISLIAPHEPICVRPYRYPHI